MEIVVRVPFTVEGQREHAKKIYAEAQELRENGLDDESKELVTKLESQADGHILVSNRLLSREKKRRNITNDKT